MQGSQKEAAKFESSMKKGQIMRDAETARMQLLEQKEIRRDNYRKAAAENLTAMAASGLSIDSDNYRQIQANNNQNMKRDLDNIDEAYSEIDSNTELALELEDASLVMKEASMKTQQVNQGIQIVGAVAMGAMTGGAGAALMMGGMAAASSGVVR